MTQSQLLSRTSNTQTDFTKGTLDSHALFYIAYLTRYHRSMATPSISIRSLLVSVLTAQFTVMVRSVLGVCPGTCKWSIVPFSVLKKYIGRCLLPGAKVQ